jgi:phosphoserine phosphatase RsbU/P
MTEKPQRYEITIVNPLFPAERRELDPTRAATIGRALECSIPVRDRYLSRLHAELVPRESGTQWVVRDCGSANGTYLNGTLLEGPHPLLAGDRIRLGDTEIVFHADTATDRFFRVAEESAISATISIPVSDLDEEPLEQEPSGRDLGRLATLNLLAAELIEDQPPDRLFGYILDRIMEHLEPARSAIALLAEGGDSFRTVEVRRQDPLDTSDLKISRTLLSEVVEEKRALAFLDISEDEKLSRAKSIIGQGIHSILCAPLLISDVVVGVLYIDFHLTQKGMSEQDVRLVAQIARFAAMKLETTRLREEALQARLLDEELKTAYTVQRGLLPEAPPRLSGYSFHGTHKPCRTVSGDYYDFIVRPDGTVYFVIADVSGKGITAALLMAGLQSAFRIFSGTDPKPAELISQLNVAMKASLPPTRFITIFVGRLHPDSGRVEYANAGHTPPLVFTASGVKYVDQTDLLLAMFSKADYRNHEIELAPGDSLVLFTDGITEAENAAGEELGTHRFHELAPAVHGRSADEVAEALERVTLDFAEGRPLQDDLTMVVVTREARETTTITV